MRFQYFIIFAVCLLAFPQSDAAFDPVADLGFAIDTTIACPTAFVQVTTNFANRFRLVWTGSSATSFFLVSIRTDTSAFSNVVTVANTAAATSVSYLFTPDDTVPSGSGLTPLLAARVEIFTFNSATRKISSRCSSTIGALNVVFVPTLTLTTSSSSSVSGVTVTSITYRVPTANLGQQIFTVTNDSTGCSGASAALSSRATYAPDRTDIVTSATCSSSTLCVSGNSTILALQSDQRCYNAYGVALTQVSNTCGDRTVAEVRNWKIVMSGVNIVLTWNPLSTAVSTAYGGHQFVIVPYDFITAKYLTTYVGTGTTVTYVMGSTNYFVLFKFYVQALGCNTYSAATRGLAAASAVVSTVSSSAVTVSYSATGVTTRVLQQVETTATVIGTNAATRRRRLHSFKETVQLAKPHTKAPIRAFSSAPESLLGCYTNDASGYPFTVALKPDSRVTLEVCREEALRSNVKYFGLAANPAALCMLSDVAPTADNLASVSCNIACPGNSSQTCGGVNAYSVYELGDYTFPAVNSYTYSSSSSANLNSSILLGNAFFSGNKTVLLSGSSQSSAVHIDPPTPGAATFASVFHLSMTNTTSKTGYGFSLNYGPSTSYAPIYDYQSVFLSGSPGLSIVVHVTSVITFDVVVSGVTVWTETNTAVTFSQVVTTAANPVRWGINVALGSEGARAHLTVKKDWYGFSNVSLGSDYAPDDTWTFRLVASSDTAPQNMNLHNLKIWSGESLGVPDQVAGNYTYQGCYLNKEFNPISVEVYSVPSMTIDLCHERALRGYFPYFGLTMGGTCLLGRGLPSRPSIMCNHACLYDNTQVCGGWTAYSVYSVDDLALPSESVSYMLSKYPDASLSLDNYLWNATATSTTAALTHGSSSQGQVLIPGFPTATSSFSTIFHLTVSTPTPAPSPSDPIYFGIAYGNVTTTCKGSFPANCNASSNGLFLTFDFSSVWIAHLSLAGTEFASAVVDSDQLLTESGVRYYVKLRVSQNTTGDALVSVEVGNDVTVQSVFSNVVIPASLGYAPTSDWSFLLFAKSSSSVAFQPEVYSFLAFLETSTPTPTPIPTTTPIPTPTPLPVFPDDWTFNVNGTTDANNQYRFVTEVSAGATSVTLAPPQDTPMTIYVFQYDANGDIISAQLATFAYVPPVIDLVVDVVNCSTFNISWTEADADNSYYLVTFTNASSQVELFLVNTTSTRLIQSVDPFTTYLVTVTTQIWDTGLGSLRNSSQNPSDMLSTLGTPFITSITYNATTLEALIIYGTYFPATQTSLTLLNSSMNAVNTSTLPASGFTEYSAIVKVPTIGNQYYLLITAFYECSGYSGSVTTTEAFPIQIANVTVGTGLTFYIQNVTASLVSATSVNFTWAPLQGISGVDLIYRVCTTSVGCFAYTSDTSFIATNLRPGLVFQYYIEAYIESNLQRVRVSETFDLSTVSQVRDVIIEFESESDAEVCWGYDGEITEDIQFQITFRYLHADLVGDGSAAGEIKGIPFNQSCYGFSTSVYDEFTVEVVSYFVFDSFFPPYYSTPAVATYYLPYGTLKACRRNNTHTALVKWSFSLLNGTVFDQYLLVQIKGTNTTTRYPVSGNTNETLVRLLPGVEYYLTLFTEYQIGNSIIMRSSNVFYYIEAYVSCIIGDPHVQTWDHKSVTVRTTGDFVLAESSQTGLAIHGRFCQQRSSARASWLCALSLRCGHGETAAQVFAGDSEIVYHHGTSSKRQPSVNYDAEHDFGHKEHEEINLVCGDGVRINVLKWPHPVSNMHICARIDTAYAKLHKVNGLWGSPNNDPSDDLAFRNGTRVATPQHLLAGHIYRQIEDLAVNWKVPTHENVFVRPFPADDAHPASSITKKLHAKNKAHLTDEAHNQCTAAGLEEPYLTMCKFDYIQAPHPSVPTKYVTTHHSRHHKKW